MDAKSADPRGTGLPDRSGYWWTRHADAWSLVTIEVTDGFAWVVSGGVRIPANAYPCDAWGPRVTAPEESHP